MKHESRGTRSGIAMVLAAAMLAGLSGCRSGSDVEASGAVYPDAVLQSRVLDVQVVRDETQITLTNTTARGFGRSRLWVNAWYSAEIEQFGVGQTLNLSLHDFKDRYGTPFRAGGFWATRRPERLVLAQIEPLEAETRELIGLVVVVRGDD
ncbi:MAG: hypothetical protein KF699_11605 [Phycisphaeraceae bacterium]|nr:hypothetical protein [Phycisphaeraceae bacterium]MBX3406579.1 hypothetical protein [Phycisphaeraceae bacterium]